jgi:hypothetical protein
VAADLNAAIEPIDDALWRHLPAPDEVHRLEIESKLRMLDEELGLQRSAPI